MLPIPPMNGILGNVSRQDVGATIQFQCNEGYRPSGLMISTCSITAQWEPPPDQQVCLFVIGM